MNILIVSPSFKILGGVANHHMGLQPHWSHRISFCFQGKRKKIPAIITLIPDFLIFIFRLIFTKVDIVFINPSLRNYQLKRDSFYIKLSKLFKKKIVTFFHGWDPTLAQHIIENPKWFQKNYGACSLIFCLYSKFKEDLIKMGITCPIYLTTTKVSDHLLENFDINKRDGSIKTLLFLARLEESKGIFIVLECYKILKKENPNLRLFVCGSGNADFSAKQYVEDNKIKDVSFWGNVKGEKLKEAFEKSDVYILPTSHGEGMATSVLEAMAFGLPVISRPVGGVNDFFEDGKMGYMLNSLDPKDYAEKIQFLINNPDKTKSIGLFNHSYALEKFLASKVAKLLESHIESVINPTK